MRTYDFHGAQLNLDDVIRVEAYKRKVVITFKNAGRCVVSMGGVKKANEAAEQLRKEVRSYVNEKGE